VIASLESQYGLAVPRPIHRRTWAIANPCSHALN
jgi:hypothetical protein